MGAKRKFLSDYLALEQTRGFTLVGIMPPTAQDKTLWRCSLGHEWNTDLDSLLQGRGCPYCAGVVPKTEADYLALAAKRGLVWLDTVAPRNSATKTRWRCPNGHVWEARYNAVAKGVSCAHCWGKLPLTEDQYHALAQKHGIEWVGDTLPPTVMSRTQWRCPKGHTWQTTGNRIQAGRSCPKCIPNQVNYRRVSKVQLGLHSMIGGDVNKYVSGYCVDIALHKCGIEIAIEYDGWHWHKNQAERDAEITRRLVDAGWRVLRVKSNKLLPTHEQLDAAIDQLIAGKSYVEVILTDWGVG